MVYLASWSGGVPIRKDVQHEVIGEPPVTWAGFWRWKLGQMRFGLSIKLAFWCAY